MIANHPKYPGDVRAAPKANTLLSNLKAKRYHILQVAYDSLDTSQQLLLSQLAAFRSSVDYAALAVLNSFASDEQFEDALHELVTRGLVLWEKTAGRFGLHPVVRAYAYDRLTDKVGTHSLLRDYYAAGPLPEPENIRSLDDLSPLLELYHHTGHACQFDAAMDFFYKRLANSLFRFGAHRTRISLLSALFPDGEGHPPRLKDTGAQAWTLNALANSYSLLGEPRKAAALFQMAVAIGKKRKDMKNVAIRLGNLALDQTRLGELRAAKANLRQQIEIAAGIADDLNKAVSHQELGYVLSICGEFTESAEQLDNALSTFVALSQTDTVQSFEVGSDEWSPEEKRQIASRRQGLDRAYRAFRGMLINEFGLALDAAKDAYRIATNWQNKREFIRAGWLLGALYLRLEQLPEADTHLVEALTRCRKIELVELEPDILLELARLRFAQAGNEVATANELKQEAHLYVNEALLISDHCEYRLKQADIHNFLARMLLYSGERNEARTHAEIARERAWCDGPPHCYKSALDQAEWLLNEIKS